MGPVQNNSLTSYTYLSLYRNFDSEARPTFYEVHGLLNFPEFKVLKWSAADVEKYSEAARTIGAPLAEGEDMFTELQSAYR